MSILLIGYRGSGKTTLGRRLAVALRWGFVDLDVQITDRAGLSIRDIFSSRGELGFRALETEALSEAIELKNHVISLGGGAVLAEQNRAMIRSSGHLVVYLHATPEVLHERIHADPATAAQRPGLTHLGGNMQEVRSLLVYRHPLYKELADIELDVNSSNTDRLVEHLLARLPER